MAQEEEINLDQTEKIQTRLHSALVKQATGLGLAAGDWVQGGWSRSGKNNIMDKVDVGYKPTDIAKKTVTK